MPHLEFPQLAAYPHYHVGLILQSRPRISDPHADPESHMVGLPLGASGVAPVGWYPKRPPSVPSEKV